MNPARGAGGDDVEDADEEEDGCDADHALEENFAAAVGIYYEPGEDVAEDSAGGDADA